MSDFFELPPPAPEQRRPPPAALPPWLAAPAGTLPGVVALELVLAQSAQVAVCLGRVSAYPTGFQLELLVLAHPDSALEIDPFLFGMGHRPGRDPAALAARLRFGLQYSDGAKATNLDARERPSSGPPAAPVLNPGGGGGGGANWRQHIWVWPLPPPGPLAFVCEWPAAQIALTRHELDAGVIIDAAARARAIFPPGPSVGGGWSSHAFHSS